MKLFSVDAEVDTLYGVAFAIAATVRVNGQGVDSFVGRIPDHALSHCDWVRENVLPAVQDIPISHERWQDLEEAFWSFWMKHREGSTVIAHCGYPVEANLFRRCVDRNPSERQWLGPYPCLHDVGTLLLSSGKDASSVDAYLREKSTPTIPGSPHHPMYDALSAAMAWERLFCVPHNPHELLRQLSNARHQITTLTADLGKLTDRIQDMASRHCPTIPGVENGKADDCLAALDNKIGGLIEACEILVAQREQHAAVGRAREAERDLGNLRTFVEEPKMVGIGHPDASESFRVVRDFIGSAKKTRKDLAQVLDLIEQYTRIDFYHFITSSVGQQSDPTKRANEAKALLQDALRPAAKDDEGGGE